MGMYATISQRGVLHRHAILGPYNTMHLLGFLDGLRERVFQLDQREPAQPVQPCYVVVWDNVSFHHSALVRDWFTNKLLHIFCFFFGHNYFFCHMGFTPPLPLCTPPPPPTLHLFSFLPPLPSPPHLWCPRPLPSRLSGYCFKPE